VFFSLWALLWVHVPSVWKSSLVRRVPWKLSVVLPQQKHKKPLETKSGCQTVPRVKTHQEIVRGQHFNQVCFETLLWVRFCFCCGKGRFAPDLSVDWFVSQGLQHSIGD